MSRRWIRLDVEWDASDWLVGLEPGPQLAWVKLLCWVKVHGKGGRSRALSAVAAGMKWGIPREAVDTMTVVAVAHGALSLDAGDWVIAKWGEYQEPDQTATERKRKQRSKIDDGHAESQSHDESRRDTRDRGCDPSRDHRPPTTDRDRAETEHTHPAREEFSTTEPADELDDLANWLGGHAPALPNWPPLREPELRRTLWQLYGPPGMRPNVWKREDGTSAPPEDRARLFVVALSGYAGEGKRTLVANEFAGALGSVVRAEYRTLRTPPAMTNAQEQVHYAGHAQRTPHGSDLKPLTTDARKADADATAEKQREANAAYQAETEASEWLETQDLETKARAALIIRAKLKAQFSYEGAPANAPKAFTRRIVRETVEQIRAERAQKLAG